MDEKLIFDKTELIYSDMTSGRQVMRNVVYSDIKSILVGRKLVKKFFGLYRKVTPAILITVNGVSYPLDVLECEEGPELFAKYVEKIRAFAHDNHVTIRDMSPDDPPYGAKEDWRLSRGQIN